MLRVLGRKFRNFRIFIGAIRAGIYGLVLVAAGWIFVAPVSSTEAAQLGVQQSSATPDANLRAHRIAKLLLIVGTDRTYDLIASRAGNGLTGDDIRLNVQIAARGRPIGPDEWLGETPAEPVDDGAKFIVARTD